MFSLRAADLDRLNSLTKYPSIPTYHKLGDRGMLTPECAHFTGPVHVSEKVDGTNARIVLTPDGGAVIGSREEFLWAVGDLIVSPAQGIAPTLKALAERECAAPRLGGQERVVVLYFEVYGGNINAYRQYTGAKTFAFRLFDVCFIDDYAALLERDVQALASWRDHGGQRYEDVASLAECARLLEVETVPQLTVADGSVIPTALADTQRWLEAFGTSRCTLDAEAGAVPEGVVVRTPDRKHIAKLRREDYSRALRKNR